MNNVNDVNIKLNSLTNNIDPVDQLLISKLDKLYMKLNLAISEGLIVAFSGGVDSAFLLWAAKKVYDKNSGKLLAITTDSPSLARTELKEAITFAKNLDVPHKIEESKEFDNPEYIKNDLNRCYFCKNELFRITSEALNSGEYKWVAYGYNDSDRSDFRPGHKAALENEILAPLADVGLTKDEIRKMLSINGIDISDKPSSPCLSSRIMTGISISEKRINDIEEIELLIEQAGIKIKRVRICKDENQDFLRIEIGKDEMKQFLEIGEKISREGIARGYKWVTLDLSGYKMGGGVN